MSQNRQIRCKHCHTLVQCGGHEGEARFWVRCGGCGRPVMPKDWGEIVADPEPAVLFEPLVAGGAGPAGETPTSATPTFAAMRRAVWESRSARRDLLLLIAASGIVTGVSGGVYSGWYLATDVIFSALVGVGIAAMSLLVPELMIALASGSISCWFCAFLFGTYGDYIQTLISYFCFGFIFAVFVQVGRYQIMSRLAMRGRYDALQEPVQQEIVEEVKGE